MNHFYKDIFGWFDFEDVYQYAVRSFPSGSKFVEVGVYKGKATAFLGVEIINSGKDISLTAIDIFDPMPTEMLQGVSYSFDEFMVNMKPITDAEKFDFSVIKGECIKTAKQFKKQSIDFIFIDANHDYEFILKDIKSWLPKLKKGGIIGGHDFTDNWPGVKKAVKEMFGNDFKVIGNSWIHEIKSL
jgi:predicted O-methyltransferase YrrM